MKSFPRVLSFSSVKKGDKGCDKSNRQELLRELKKKKIDEGFDKLQVTTAAFTPATHQHNFHKWNLGTR